MLFFSLILSVTVPSSISNQLNPTLRADLLAAVPTCTQLNTNLNELVPQNLIDQIPENVKSQLTPSLLLEIANSIPVCNATNGTSTVTATETATATAETLNYIDIEQTNSMTNIVTKIDSLVNLVTSVNIAKIESLVNVVTSVNITKIENLVNVVDLFGVVNITKIESLVNVVNLFGVVNITKIENLVNLLDDKNCCCKLF